MKKALLIIAFLLILAAVPVSVFLVKQRQEIRQRAVAATHLAIDPTPIETTTGNQFDVTVRMDTGSNNVSAAEIIVTFSAQYLEVMSINAGTALPNVLASGTTDNPNGTASITVGVSGGQTMTGVSGQNLHVASLTFRAKADTPTPTHIQLSQSQVSAAGEPGDNPNVLSGTTLAQVTIGVISASPSPSTSPGVSPSPSPSATPLASPSPSPSATPGTGGPNPTPSPSPSASPQKVTTITSPANGTTVTTRRPVISGASFANATMTLSINTSPVTVAPQFTANSSGNWSYTPTNDLTNGTYTVTVTGESATGTTETATSTFTVSVSGTGGTTVATPTPTSSTAVSAASPTSIPVTGSTTPTFLLLGMAILILLLGGGAAILTK